MGQLGAVQKNAARQWRDNNTPIQESLWFKPTIVYVGSCWAARTGGNEPFTGIKNLTNDAKWRLAGAYALAGKEQVAKGGHEKRPTLILCPNVTIIIRMVLPGTNAWLFWKPWCCLGMKPKGYGHFGMKELSSQRWFSTQETAYAFGGFGKNGVEERRKAMEVSLPLVEKLPR